MSDQQFQCGIFITLWVFMICSSAVACAYLSN